MVWSRGVVADDAFGPSTLVRPLPVPAQVRSLVNHPYNVGTDTQYQSDFSTGRRGFYFLTYALFLALSFPFGFGPSVLDAGTCLAR